MGEGQLSDEAAVMLAALREKIAALDDLPLEDVPPVLGDPRRP